MIKLTTILCLLPTLTWAEGFSLQFPVDCKLGETCFIQNYVDIDPGSGWKDFSCGHLSYDGHNGTDIALFTEANINPGVAVLAAAPGTIRATREGMPDILATHPDAPDLTNRSCGNAVVIDHIDGWQTTYCHLMRGSVAVRSGDVVPSGMQIGTIGLSGRTEFPHLHLTLRRGKAVVDPFLPSSGGECGTNVDTLWKEPISYVSAGFLTAGAAENVPSYEAIKTGMVGATTLSATAPALVFWAHYFGPRAGDILRVQVEGPEGEFFNQTIEVDRTQVRAFRALGRKRRNQPWPEGNYRAVFELFRDGSRLDHSTVETTIID